jgi:serpin B
VDSVLEKLEYLKTDRFEAVALPCGRVSMIAVLPREGMKIHELEETLVDEPDALKSMKPSLGSVTIPIFTIRATMHLEGTLKAMGVKDIFENLEGVVRRDMRFGPKGSFDVPVAQVTDVGQAIDFTADKHGIHADAETVIGAIPAGLIMATDSFHLVLNRPFVFLVRENASGALLFAGALMDPSAVK